MNTATADGKPLVTVLIVDDDRAMQTLLAQFVANLGYRVLTASSGPEAIRIAAEEHPDVVLTDLHMPVMDGYAVTTHIKAAASGRYLPVIFLSGDSDETALIQALEAGADDYLLKPVRFPVFAAKLRAVVRTLLLSREVEERNRQLAAYQVAEQQEARIAQHVISRLTRGELLDDPALRHWIRPGEGVFSGDMLLAARTPSDNLHVLLADAAGHGLAAALNALPVTQPFYAMTENGFPIDRIVAEINGKIRSLLPIERFVAASAIAVNFQEQVISIWNGGNPPVMIIDEQGETLFAARSRHLPLGVAEKHLFSAGMDVYHYDRRCQVVACSDGMMELEDERGKPLVCADLLLQLGKLPFGERLPALRQRTEALPALAGAVDDISVLLVDCSIRDRAQAAPAPSGEQPEAPTHGAWSLGLSLSAEELKYVDVVPLLLNMVRNTACGKRYARQIFVILSELFNNALDHGLLGLNSQIKLEEDGFSRYLDLRVHGLQHLRDAHIEVKIAVVDMDGWPMLRIVVRDSGSGFDYARLAAAEMPGPEQPFGRGIASVRRLCHRVEYQGAGNEVVVHYALDEQAGGAGVAISPGVAAALTSL